jgi:hypothetical protein
MTVRNEPSPAGEALIRSVEQFLYREARLLDDRRFHEWLHASRKTGSWPKLDYCGARVPAH